MANSGCVKQWVPFGASQIENFLLLVSKWYVTVILSSWNFKLGTKRKWMQEDIVGAVGLSAWTAVWMTMPFIPILLVLFLDTARLRLNHGSSGSTLSINKKCFLLACSS